jgi:copper chaperone CopZ
LPGCSGGGAGPGAKAQYEQHPVNHEVSESDKVAAKSTEPVAADSAVLWVNGLGCPLCATNIDKQLERVKGVSKVDVDLSNGKVKLGLKPGGPHPSPAVLGEAVEDAGFTLVKIERP